MRPSDKAATVVGWMQRKAEGYPLMTAVMLLALKHLESIDGYAPLTDLHRSTITALIDRDWIFESNGEYKITHRGSNALRVYSAPRLSHGRDGICPGCGKNPKHVYRTGRVAGYCYDCQRKNARKSREFSWKQYGRNQRVPGSTCPRCNKRACHVTKSGMIRAYCLPCRRELSKKYRRDSQRRLRERIEAGEVLLCYRCKSRPRHYTANTVYDYCEPCLRTYTREYHKQLKGQNHANN